MKRRYILIIGLLLIFGLFLPKQANVVKVANKTKDAVVWIGAEWSENTLAYEWFGPEFIAWQGTGFLISEDGLICTAGHVISGATNFQLMFADGRSGRAKKVYMESRNTCDCGFIQVTWIEPDDDLFHIMKLWLGISVVKPEPIKNLPYLEFADVKWGEETLILGYPWGWQDGVTLTTGIISALNRVDLSFGEKFLIHSDAATWPGNSGSPVVNLKGKVLGILVGGVVHADCHSLAIPSRIVQLVLDKFRAEKVLKECE